MTVEVSPERLHPILESLKPLVISLAETFGPDCEVVLHDLQHPKKSVVMVANGHVTGRKVGQTFRDLVLSVLRSKRFEQDHLSNYVTRTKDGKLLKSSTVLIRDENNEVIGALCINYDLAKFMYARKVLEEFTQTVELDPDYQEEPQDVLDEDVLRILQRIIQRVIDEAGIPVAAMKKEDKLNIVNFLDEKGVFLIKGAVDHLAQALSISRYSVYNYLDEVRAMRSSAQSARREVYEGEDSSAI